MSWLNDAFWVAAKEAALAATDEADVVLVPSEFLGLHDKFAPLEYAWGLDPRDQRIAWCCSKDDVHRLAPWVQATEHRSASHAWANEVFVLGAAFAWRQAASAASRRHLPSWRERLADHRAGRSRRAAGFRPGPGAEGPQSLKGPRVLVVGASAMGNVGDDLLADVLGGMLRFDARARVWWSGPDVDPLHLRGFDAIVVGGGGLVYASRDGANESQNLANYLKFGPLAKHLGLPVALVGVSDQDHAHAIEGQALNLRFARRCLADFALASTRDEDSSALLRRLGLARVETGPDLLFAWAARARRAVHAAAPQPARLAMAGEWLGCAPLTQALGQAGHPLHAVLAGQEIDLVLMSDDDVPHAERLRLLLRKVGVTVSVQDIRGRSLDALVHAFSQYRGLLTTRFHGLVMAMLSDLPVVAWDHAEGKKARLLREVGRDDLLLCPGVSEAVFTQRLAELVARQVTPVHPLAVNRLYGAARVHRVVLRDLLSRWEVTVPEADAAEPVPAEPDSPPAIAPLPPSAAVAQRHRLADLVQRAGDEGGSVGLCWAASTRETLGYGNLGDSLSAVMVSALAGRRVHHLGFNHNGPKLVAVGSIAHAIHGGEAVIWGSGVSIRGGILAQSVPRTRYDVRAIRGPISARHLSDFGIPVPPVYGDPVWLLPSIFHEQVEKRYELGVIPHIQDIAGFGPDARPPEDSIRYQIPPEFQDSVRIINTWHDATWEGIQQTLRLILSCKRIVSQSFHGVVIAEAYGIPVLNFRQMPGLENGLHRISLAEDCTTDPRIWEFFKGGPRPHFDMYAQRRDEASDWAAIMRAVDERWEPFQYDARALVDSFPLPLAYDPLSTRLSDFTHLQGLRF